MYIGLTAKARAAIDLTGTTPVALSDGSQELFAAWARRITVTLDVESGGGNITSVRWRIRTSPDAPWGPWVTATGIAPAAGATATIDITDTVASHVDLEITPAADTSVTAYLAGV